MAENGGTDWGGLVETGASLIDDLYYSPGEKRRDELAEKELDVRADLIGAQQEKAETQAEMQEQQLATYRQLGFAAAAAVVVVALVFAVSGS